MVFGSSPIHALFKLKSAHGAKINRSGNDDRELQSKALISEQLLPDRFRILPEIHNCADDDSLGLNFVDRLKKQNEVGHRSGPRIRSRTASQVVNSPGCSRKCSIRRSNSAIISRETGTSDGWASRSFHSSETKINFSDAVSRRTSGNFSRPLRVLEWVNLDHFRLAAS